MASEIFISEFHNIEGVLVGERKRNLHKLLKNKNIAGDENKLILDNLEPKTYLETSMYIDILIYLKKTDQLMEILKNGNEACVGKIIKQQWFIIEAFDNVSAEQLVEEILPSMSLSVKMKVLKRLSAVFSEEKADTIFDAVLKRYGLFIAITVIQGCSSQKIEDVLKNYEVKLWTNQLKIIYKKQPRLIQIYLDVHKELNNTSIFENSFLIYLAQSDPAFFWNIIENYEINRYLQLGRRTTKKLFETKKHEIMNEPKKYVTFLNYGTLVRNLIKLGEFKQLYQNLFPREMEELDEYILCNRLLSYCPKHSQYQLYAETFNEVLLKCLDEYLLETIADKELREKLARLKYSETDYNNYIKYYKPESCFTLVKERIKLTPHAYIDQRITLLRKLLECCAVNNDLECLEEVLRYFCESHRNAHVRIISCFLDTIESEFILSDLNEKHWKYINEILLIQESHSCQSKLRLMIIKRLYQNKHPEDDINRRISEYLKYSIRDFCERFLSLDFIKDSEIEKKILMKYVEYILMVIKTEKVAEHRSTPFLSGIIAEIFSYNLRHPKSIIMISENEKVVEILKTIMQSNYVTYGFLRSFSRAICKLNRNNLENELLTYYWEKLLSRFSQEGVMHWYLKNDPLAFLESIDQILKSTSHYKFNIWPKVKLYSHLNLDNIVINCCLKQLDDCDDDDRTEIIRRISILATPENYIKIMENANLIPTSSKLIIEDQRENNTYTLQQAFLTNFRNLRDPLKYLPLLIDTFCQGDYLRTSLIGLYSAFHKCPENELTPYLNKLFKNPHMSVKKHALNLACCVFDQQMVFKILNDLEKNKGNSSLQKCTFLSCLKYFSRNPSKELFEKVILHMDFLKQQDNESLNILHAVNISSHYKPFYIQHILKLLEKFKDKDKEGNEAGYNSVISSILDLIDEKCIQMSPQVFLQEIIQKYFLTNEDVPGIFSFVINVLRYHDEKMNNFEFIFKLLSNYKLQYWHSDSMIKQRENIYTFFKTFYRKALGKEVAMNFVEQFYNNWEKVFTPVEMFEEYVLLNLLRFKKETENDPETYSQKIVLFSEKVVEQFGQITFSKFVTILAKSFNSEPKEKINLLSNMLKFKTTTLNCILVIEIIVLNKDLFYKDKIRHMYCDIDSVLKEVTDPNVKLYYNLYLKQ